MMDKMFGKLLMFALTFMVLACSVFAVQAPVNFGDSFGFVILGESLISDATPANSSITGNIGMEPFAGTFITDISCTNVAGTIYDNNAGYTGGWDSNVTCLITNASYLVTVRSAMELAYDDARGRTGTNTTELGAGEIGGLTLTAGLYKWSSPVTITNDVVLDCAGDSSAVFIMQMSQTLNIANGKRVNLTGGCDAGNIFWQADTGVTIGTTAVFNGNILAGTAITVNSGAEVNGRLFAQTAVTLDNNIVTIPAGTPCTESWSEHHTICTGTNTLYYLDDNSCGTTTFLPVDNGTVSTCGGSGAGGMTYSAPVVTSSNASAGNTVVAPAGTVVKISFWTKICNWFKHFFNAIIEFFRNLFSFLGR